MAKALTSGTSSEKFYRKLKSSRTYEKGQEAEDGIFASGTVLNNFPLRKNVFTALCNFLGSIQIVSSVKMFKRVKIKQQIFHSQSYTKRTARNGFTVLYHQERRPERKRIGSVEIISSIRRHAPCVPLKIIYADIITLLSYNLCTS